MSDLARLDALRGTAAARAAADDGSVRGPVMCLECSNVRMVCTDETGCGDHRPCSRCNPAGYERWRGGHYARDHSCEACLEMRRTQTKASR